jgi:hypothetical protein
MLGYLHTAGEALVFDTALPWVGELIAEGSAGELAQTCEWEPTVSVQIEAARRPFDTRRWDFVTRGVWAHGGEVVVANACTSGFDLHLAVDDDRFRFTYRWRPPFRDRAASRVLRSRFHLLARAVLMQYPALWVAATRGRVPLHASACVVGARKTLLTAPSGVGRSTLLLQAGAHETSGDNLAVGDGTTVWGLVEPMRVEGAGGRRMPHGRNEAAVDGRVDSLVPDALVVLSRRQGRESAIASCSSLDAARSLVTSTYMAGELRRYWAFAAALSAATVIGPPHPPIADVASAFAARLSCYVLELGSDAAATLATLGRPTEVAA